MLPLPDLSCSAAIVTRPPITDGSTLTAESIVEYLRSPAIDLWRELSRVLKPGAHLLCFGGPFTFDLVAVGIRAAGFECRDTIAHQQAGPTWVPILVFRKPVEESTVAKQVLKTGTGAINIEACRIETSDNLNGGAYSSQSGYVHRVFNSPLNYGCGEYQQPAGRWPANLTLQHAGCDESGCIEGCPVKVLDGQSGHQVSGTAYEPQGRKMNRNIYGEFNTLGRVLGYGDSGGASRYFAQFQTDQQTLDWLVTLVTPAGGTTLIVQRSQG